ncbi:Hypothetical protein I596_937 [Dokdonella koreensis DS-123]|uniref:Uncharacterized protein n=1 Tax=Dokdonella koreensis DS-123 TaxID=1300342 RepID=A0A160DRW3_9GAMM|nr:Hypothetical protein I596_937 [Dokdonella koreensis DS-123]
MHAAGPPGTNGIYHRGTPRCHCRWRGMAAKSHTVTRGAGHSRPVSGWCPAVGQAVGRRSKRRAPAGIRAMSDEAPRIGGGARPVEWLPERP